MFEIRIASFSEEVYATMCGNLISGFRIVGVENAFAEGKDCDRWLRDAYEARDRVRERLGVNGEDEDLECILNSLLCIEHTLCLKMYEYGAKFGMRE